MGKIKSTAKKAQGIVGGGALVVCAFVIMWGGVSKEATTSNSLKGVAERAVDIDAASPDPADNGKAVAAPGLLRSSDVYEDEYLKSSQFLIVRRRVEMFQWVETKKVAESAPSYAMRWVEGQVDFFRFVTPQGHENPLFQVAPQEFRVQQARFGGFDGIRLLPLIKKLDLLSITPAMLKDPSLEIKDNKIVIRRSLGSSGESLGDMRVWYEVLAQGDYTVLTVQEDERSLVGAAPSTTLFIEKGLLSAGDFIDKLEEESEESFKGMLYMGAVLLFIGGISLLAPHAQKFDLNPHLNLRGMPAVAVVSAALAFGVMCLFYILSLTS